MTKILIFSPKYPPYGGGSLTYFSNLINSLSEKYEFYVITAYHPEKQVIGFDDNGNNIYRIIPLYTSLPNILRLLIESIVGFFISLYLLFSKNIDISHIHPSSYSSPAITISSKITKTPIVYDCRDEGFPRWLIKLGQSKIIFSCSPKIDNILIKSGISKENILRTAIINPKYVRKYKLTEKQIEKKIKNENVFEILFIGKLKRQKGVDILLESFNKFIQENTSSRLIFVGEGRYRKTIEKFVKQNDLQEKVDIKGEVPHTKALQYISKADVLVHPSYKETGPRVVKEGLEIGTPVVATPVGIVPENIEHGCTGLIIRKDDVNSTLDALTKIYNNPSLREILAKNGQEDTDNNWKKVSENVSRGYKKILNNE